MRYLTAEQILFIHSRIIEETGGAHGVRDLGLLQSAVARPQATFGRKELHSNLITKAGALIESLARNHPFIDGNKRTAITATGVFFAINGLRLDVSQKELERFALDIAVGKLSLEDAAAWFKKRVIPARK